MKLKPCPVCGSENIDIGHNSNYSLNFVFCNECNTDTGFQKTQRKAKKEWNEMNTFDPDYAVSIYAFLTEVLETRDIQDEYIQNIIDKEIYITEKIAGKLEDKLKIGKQLLLGIQKTNLLFLKTMEADR